jgi:hypothetical protein
MLPTACQRIFVQEIAVYRLLKAISGKELLAFVEIAPQHGGQAVE